MLKLILPDAKITDLTEEQLQYLHWGSLTKDDVLECSTDFLNTNFSKLSTNLKKHLIMNKRIDANALTEHEWKIYIREYSHYSCDMDVFQYIQFPYSLNSYFIESSMYITRIAATQKAIPIEYAANRLSIDDLNTIFFYNTNPALIDFVCSEYYNKDGSRKMWDELYFLTSEEGKALGVDIPNITISNNHLAAADACGSGLSYVRKVLKELQISEITWDDAIIKIRNSTKLQNNANTYEYMKWISRKRKVLQRIQSRNA